MTEPTTKRAIVFIDGQNLYHCAKGAGFCREPDFDAHRLAEELCRLNRWTLEGVRFYTGIASPQRVPRLFNAWQAKLNRMEAQGVVTTTRPLRYDRDGQAHEKGIDVRIALDVVHLGRLGFYDVGVIISQDQDLREAVHELRDIAKAQQQWVKLASTFVENLAEPHRNRGIYDTQWLKIDKALYDLTREKVPFYPVIPTP
jgi:uncharacterized LabA/DUF88 family protein